MGCACSSSPNAAPIDGTSSRRYQAPAEANDSTVGHGRGARFRGAVHASPAPQPNDTEAAPFEVRAFDLHSGAASPARLALFARGDDGALVCHAVSSLPHTIYGVSDGTNSHLLLAANGSAADLTFFETTGRSEPGASSQEHFNDDHDDDFEFKLPPACVAAYDHSFAPQTW